MVVKCPCGHDKAEVNGVLACAHCDAPCLVHPNVCRWCRSFSTHVNLRVNAEMDAERKQRG